MRRGMLALIRVDVAGSSSFLMTLLRFRNLPLRVLSIGLVFRHNQGL